LDISVGDSYLGGLSILPQDGADCGAGTKELELETDASVPDAASGDGGSSAGGFPTHEQDHSLSCEYASIQVVTTWFGSPIWEDESLAMVPSAVDPHYGFRGDIDGPFGSSDDYGVYAEALVPVLNAYGYNGDVWYGADAGSLEAQLDAGHPTLIWIATRGDTGFYDEDANGNTFKLVPWEHVVVAYAYDSGGVYISDPGTGALDYLSWGWTLDAWSVLDGMALSIYPA
ncbi:MAG TPA: C39 family peptidase, partial [Thermomicrobiales bacterium]